MQFSDNTFLDLRSPSDHVKAESNNCRLIVCRSDVTGTNALLRKTDRKYRDSVISECALGVRGI